MSQLWSKMVLNNSEYRKFHANRWLLLPSRRNFDWHPGNILFELRCGWCGIEGTGNFSVLKFNSNSIILMAFENTWWKHASKCTWEFSSVRWEFAPIEGVQRPMVTCMRSARTCMTYVPNTRGKRRSEMSSVPIGFSVFIFVYTISVCARKSMWSGIQLAANINPLFIFTQTNKQTNTCNRLLWNNRTEWGKKTKGNIVRRNRAQNIWNEIQNIRSYRNPNVPIQFEKIKIKFNSRRLTWPIHLKHYYLYFISEQTIKLICCIRCNFLAIVNLASILLLHKLSLDSG